MSNIRIVYKILLMLLLMAGLAVGLTSTALVKLQALDEDYASLMDHQAAGSLSLARANTLLNATSRDVYLMIAEEEDAKIRQVASALDSESKGTLNYLEKAAAALPSSASEIAGLSGQVEAMIRIAERAKTEALKNNDDAARKIVVENFDPAWIVIRAKFRELIDHIDQHDLPP